MEQTHTVGPEGCPQVQPFECRVSRAYNGKEDTNIISLQVELLDPITFPRSDGEPARSRTETFGVTCLKDRSPEAFNELMSAKVGTEIRLTARLNSRSCFERGSGGKGEWAKRYADLEAIEVETLTVQMRKSDLDKANV